ncbi:MAG: hypothetical protein ACREK4_00060 [Candidatus Rokuibacteriota bacterium]
MTSVRERILQGVVGMLAPVATAHQATLHRSPALGITREQSPALLVFPESDAIAERPNDRVERRLVVRIVALARGDDGATTADALLVAAHAALFADPNLGGLCLGIRELDCEWDIEDADATAAAIPARYEITYRTRFDDLSVQG